AQMRHAAQVVHVPMGQDHARRLAPRALAEIVGEHVHVSGHSGARVDQDGIAPSDEVGVGARARHHARIEAEHAPNEIARRGALRKVRIDPAHATPQAYATPRYLRLMSSSASRPAGVPSQTIWPLLIT